MKKKGIATLALAGALAAATMVPAFAAGTQTTVGYTAGGNVDPTGRVMVTVPKDVTFKAVGEKMTGFDVNALVWDAATNTWVEPGTIKLGKTIDVSVVSTNGFRLTNTGAAGAVGNYQYAIDGGQTYAPTADETADKQSKTVGTLKDETSDGAADQKYALTGNVTMTVAPNLGQTEMATLFSDVLTFSFSNMA